MNELPQNLKDLTTNLEEIMETTEAVKGEAFANLVRYLLNTQSLIKAIHGTIFASMEANENILLEEEDNFISGVLRSIMMSNTRLVIEALELTEDQVAEVMKQVESIGKQIKSAVNKESK